MQEKETHFGDRICRAELSRTPVGSPIAKIVPINAKGSVAHHHQVAAFTYDLAAEMEKRTEALDTRWAISVEALDRARHCRVDQREPGKRRGRVPPRRSSPVRTSQRRRV